MLGLPFYVILILFGLTTHVKRLHDLGFSGWMVLFNLTIVFIPISFIFLGFRKGTEGPNRYGDHPRKAYQSYLAKSLREREQIITWAEAALPEAEFFEETPETDPELIGRPNSRL